MEKAAAEMQSVALMEDDALSLSTDTEAGRSATLAPRLSQIDAHAQKRRLRMLSDFTLGFADGLTVPFALTAGLSSLGQTDTVIYAGLAEICAGSISMGVGGYLAARGDCIDGGNDDDGDEPNAGHGYVGLARCDADNVEEYLRPLNLPHGLLRSVVEHVRSSTPHSLADAIQGTPRPGPQNICSPLAVGLSIALGYLVGGALPLFPYFFASSLRGGLYWSFAVCFLALFLFGCGRRLTTLMSRPAKGRELGRSWMRRSTGWPTVRSCLWEGSQMAVLGGAAAVVAVLCVKGFAALKAS
jgi:vacuolar iron transporter family protein